MPQQASLPWHSDMQLAGKLVLSAAALLLLAWAYRFYKSRSLAEGKIPLAGTGEERENAARDGDGAVGLRRRRVLGEELRRDGGDGEVSVPRARHTPPPGHRRLPRGQEEEEEEEGEGEEMVSEAEVTRGREGMAGKGSELGSELGSEMGSKFGSKAGIRMESDLGNEPGSVTGREPGNKLGNKAGIKLGSELGNKQGSVLANEQGSELGSEEESELASMPGSEPGNELGSEPGKEPRSRPGSKAGSKAGRKQIYSDPGDTAERVSSCGQEDTLAPDTGPPPGLAVAQMAPDGHTQSTQQDLAIGGMSLEAKGSRGTIQTLTASSDLGLMMTARDVGSDASYSFSSVSKIQVEENYISDLKGGAGKPVPGLKGKVYDYYVQSISQSVSKKRSLPYIPPGTSQNRHPERIKEELQSFATQELDTASATQGLTTSSIVTSPAESLDVSPEPPSPGCKEILQVTDSPHPQLPMKGFGVTAPVSTPPTSPRLGLLASNDLFQTPPPTHVDLGNCYEVLCRAKAQKLSHLQEAAYEVMSNNYLQVLRTPSIYGHLNAGERDLILRRRMRGKTHVVVADIDVQEPDLHTSRLCYYDDGGDRWHHLCHVPPEVVSRGCAMCSMFNYLFVAAGCEGMGGRQRPSNRVFCYDPLSNVWREIRPLN
ncbi:PREDICTED: kelch domain-containing protein 7A-like, partial [Merops nubicus]|uniref:kelch domain-containing protein 7A-like n=1 Tax=Merops nubicus TaxID=57421 RepID=UPI0004F04DAF